MRPGFGVRVGQYMIGFGPTLWSRRIGETEYGFKALPLGGYISMAGMYPPSRRAGAGGGADGSGTEGKAGGGFFATMLLGVVGALVGGFIGQAVGLGGNGFWSIGTWILAIIGTLVVLFIWGLITGRKAR